MDSVVRTRKPKAPTLRKADWAPHRERVVQLHITENLPLKDVRHIMQRDYGFNAEVRQYRTRISKWKLDKNVKTKEMKAIVRKSQHRDLVETSRPALQFSVRDQLVEHDKVARWMRAHNVDEGQIYSPYSVASTPSAVDYWTMSEQGTPIYSPDRTPTHTPISTSTEACITHDGSLNASLRHGHRWRSSSPAPTVYPSSAEPVGDLNRHDCYVDASMGTPRSQSEEEIEDADDVAELSRAFHTIDLEAEITIRSTSNKDTKLTGTYFVPDLIARKRADPLYHWVCCGCDHGLHNSWLYNPNCLNCGHRLCNASCVIEAVVADEDILAEFTLRPPRR